MSTLKTNNIQHVDRSDPSIIINTDGSVNVAGVLTYEDVTSVDAVGIITGREIINAQKQVHVGTGVSVKAGGLNVTAGITTVQALQATTGAFSDTVTVTDNIQHVGDANTQIRFPAADTFTIETSGSERVRVDSGGQVGLSVTPDTWSTGHGLTIGTSQATLWGTGDQVNLSGNAYFNSGWKAAATKAGASQIEQGLGNIDFKVSGSVTADAAITFTNALRIAKTGNIGINETSPGQKLTVGGDIQIGFNTPNDAGRQLNFNVNRGSAGDTLANLNWQWNSKFVAQIRGIAGDDTSNKDDAHLAFFTSSANNLTERMRITSDGKIGIGLTNPGSFNAGADDLVIQRNGNAGITIDATSSSNSNIFFADGSDGSEPYRGYCQYVHSSDTFILGRGGVDHMFLQNDGGTKNVLGNFIVGAAGRGLQFNAADSGSSEILDDYEEGDWTPAYGSSAVPSSTYNVTGGRYTRVGRLVTVTGRIQMTNSTVNGNTLTMGGFPFTVSVTNFPGGLTFTYNDNYLSGTGSANAQLSFLLVANTQYGYFYDGDGNTVAANGTYDSARRTLHFFGSYETDA